MPTSPSWGDYLWAGLTALSPNFGHAYNAIDAAQTGAALKDINSALDYNTIQDTLNTASTALPNNLESLQKAAMARKSLLDTNDPTYRSIVGKLASMDAQGNSYDPNFNGSEWVKGMLTTGNDQIMDSNKYDELRASQGLTGNQLIPQLLQQAEEKAQRMGNLYRAADDINSDRFNPGTITEFLSPTGLGAMTTGEKGTGGASLADKLIALKKQAEEGQGATNLQTFLNAVGKGKMADSPELNALYFAAPRGVKPADLETISKNTNIAPTVSYHDIGGPDNTVQLAGFDTRGRQVRAYGVPTDKRPVTTVNVSPELPTQTAMKTFGEQTMKDLSKGAEETRKLADENEIWLEMKKLAQSNNNTGMGADTMMKAKQFYAAATGKDPKGLTDEQVMKGLNTLAAGKAARQGDSNPTQQQIENYRKAYPGLNTTQAANLYMTDRLIATNSRKIQEHNARAAQVAKWPGAEKFGEVTAGQHTVKDPAAAIASGAAAELARRKAARGRK